MAALDQSAVHVLGNGYRQDYGFRSRQTGCDDYMISYDAYGCRLQKKHGKQVGCKGKE